MKNLLLCLMMSFLGLTISACGQSTTEDEGQQQIVEPEMKEEVEKIEQELDEMNEEIDSLTKSLEE